MFFDFEPTQTFFVCLTNPHLDSDTHRHLSSLTCCSVWLMPSRYVRWERSVAAAMLEWMLRVFDFSPLRHDKTTTVSNNAAMETESEEYVTMARVSRSPSNCCLANREREREGKRYQQRCLCWRRRHCGTSCYYVVLDSWKMWIFLIKNSFSVMWQSMFSWSFFVLCVYVCLCVCVHMYITSLCELSIRTPNVPSLWHWQRTCDVFL